jgi:putative endopeptidase
MRSCLAVASLLTLAACSGPTKNAPPAPAPAPAPAPGPPHVHHAEPTGRPDRPMSAAPAGPMTLADSGIVPDWIDASADPCADFFQYACGKFVETAQIPSDRAQWGALTLVGQAQEDFLHELLEKAAKAPGNDPTLKKIGDHYAACMDEAAIDKAGLTPIAPLLQKIDAITDAKDVPAIIAQLHSVDVRPFFDLSPAQDFVDATQEIASLDQRGLGLPDRDYYLKSDGNLKKVRDAYVAHVERTFLLAGAAAADAKAATADVMRVETALAKLAQDKVTRRDPRAVYHRVERAGLKKAAPNFPWDAYFETLGLGAVTQISVNDARYFTGLDKLLRSEKLPAIKHYLAWTLLHATSKDLSRPFVDEDFTMTKVLTGQQELAPRWRRCVTRVDNDLGELLGQPYVAVRFAGNSKQLAIDLTEAVREAIRAEIDRLPWMDDATRAAAKAKLDKMGRLVGYPDTWRNYDFTISRTDFMANVAAASHFEVMRQLAKIGKPVDKKEWGMTPPTVNAYYDPSMNQIALPAGQLQPPFFGATFHPAVNFGSTGGGTIGHEMTHGFDDEGSQFDGDGNLRDWWSKATSKKFKAATKCVQDQYARYEAVPGVHLNGKLTSGENIADIGGVKLGFLAYQAWRAQQKTPPPAKVGDYSDDQLYFLAYAQSWCMKTTPEQLENQARTNPHSPAKWRVDGVIVDQPGFGPAFTCKAGTPMNPGNACSVW